MTDWRRPLLLTAGCLLAFVVLLVLVAVGGPVDSLDHTVRSRLLDHPDRPLLGLAQSLTDVISPLADGLVLTAGAAMIAGRRRSLAPLLAAALTGWVMVLVVVVVKEALGRPAPFPAPPAEGNSFPSGHTAAALVCLGTLALLAAAEWPRWTRVLVGAAAAISLAVAAALVYSNYHWLSDTIASLLLGVGLLVPLHRWLSPRA